MKYKMKKNLIILLCVLFNLNVWATIPKDVIIDLPDSNICVNELDSLGNISFIPSGSNLILPISIPIVNKEDHGSISLKKVSNIGKGINSLPTYTVSVTSEGDNGYVSCANDQVRNGTKTYSVQEGDDFSITAIPEEGFRVKYIRYERAGYISYTTDYTDRETQSHSKTLYDIKTDVTFTIVFEKIPDVLPTYTVSVTSEGDNGYVSCANDQVRNGTKTYSVQEGDDFSITAIPEEGFRVKYIRYERAGYISYTTDYTDRETQSHSKTLYDIKTDVTFIVEFEKIYEGNPIHTITLMSNTNYGITKHANDIVRNSTKTYSVEEGSDFTLTAIPDEGYRVKSIFRSIDGEESQTLTYNDKSSVEQTFTSYSVSKNQYIEVNFERIPGEKDNNIYLSIIQASEDSVKLQVESGERVKLYLKATDNWKIHSVSYNGTDVTSQIVNNIYTTPAIYQSSAIYVLYESYNTRINNTQLYNNVRVSVGQGFVQVFNIIPRTLLRVYSTSGQLLRQIKTSSETEKIPLQMGNIYIIKVGNRMFKIKL